MNILLIDNHDSFTYNLAHLVLEAASRRDRLTVVKNDAIDLKQAGHYDKLLLSPGPGIPDEAGQLMSLIELYAASKSILGICLGCQAIGQAFGARLVNAQTVWHGVASMIRLSVPSYLFEGLPPSIRGGRYHSWYLDAPPESLEVTAVDEEDRIMALSHRRYDVHGLQFHPESLLTPDGHRIMRNFLRH